MPRPARFHFPGAVYHVMSRGVDGRDIYADLADRLRFLTELERKAKALGADILAHCLMGNHFHLVVRVSRQPLRELMQRLLTSYALGFNSRHMRTGHLFQARYRAILCLDEPYLNNIIRYIHQNPVRAKFVSRARDWPWSSASAYEDRDGNLPDDFDPWQGTDVGETILRADASVPKSIDELSETISEKHGISTALLKSTMRLSWIKAARVALLETALLEGHAPSAVTRWLGTTPSSTARYLAKIRSCSKARRPSSPDRPVGSDSESPRP